MDPSLESLREHFFAKLDEPMAPPRECSHEMWERLVTHPWFQAELEKSANRVIARSGLLAHLVEDVRQDVVVRLAARLEHAADLGVDREQAKDHFSGWLGTIISRDCYSALRVVRSERRHEVELDRWTEMRLTSEAQSHPSVGFSRMIRSLPRRSRRVLNLYARKMTLADIAAKLGLTYWQARQAYRRGKALLAELLTRRRGA